MRSGPVRDGLNLVVVRFDPFAIHEISTKLDFALAKRAFLELSEEFLGSEVKQNSSNVGTVFVHGSRVDDDVVDVHVCKTTAVREEVVHAALECTGGIAKSERHYAALEAHKRGLKRNTRDMLVVYANFVVTLLEVHLGEIFRACHIVQQLVDARPGVLVLESDSVECAVVDAMA